MSPVRGGTPPATYSGRLASAAFWLAPSLLCLALYWRGFTAWFRADDFAWLGTGIYIQNFHDFLLAIFAPQAQGTIRPLSERAFFMLGFSLFGLDALPFKIVVFATQFANLALVASIGARLTGLRWAGFFAAVFWVLNGSGIEPLGWCCVYNQVLCGFFLLGAFHFLLRYVETGERRYNWLQWAAFLLGFGALELNVVYPLVAAAYLLLGGADPPVRGRRPRRPAGAPHDADVVVPPAGQGSPGPEGTPTGGSAPSIRQNSRWAQFFVSGSLSTLPMFAVSIAYAVAHNFAAPAWKTGGYAMHFTGAMFRTLGKYWTWSVGPTFLFTPYYLPKWLLPTGIAVVSAGLLGFLVCKLRAGERAALFCLAWYLALLAPVLPLRDHMTEYYVFLPAIGLCWLGGSAAVAGWRAGVRGRAAVVTLAAIYALMGVPTLLATSQWNHAITMRVRTLVEGVAGIHERYPSKSILLEGVDTDLFWNAVLDRPFRLFGMDHVYLAPGSEKRIATHPDLGNIGEYILPAGVVAQALQREELVVYDVRGARLRNITALYAALPRESGLPLRVDAASPLASYLLGPEWYPSDGDHRWMPRRASLRMGAPSTPGQKLYLRGDCPDALLKAGPLPVIVTVEGVTLPVTAIQPGENAFALVFAHGIWTWYSARLRCGSAYASNVTFRVEGNGPVNCSFPASPAARRRFFRATSGWRIAGICT